MDIHFIWALIIIFSIIMYTIFDGFDLGIGTLMLFFKKEEDRDVFVDTISPVWDGNESWVVLAGVGLFGGFPEAYATLLPALYIPVIIMVLSLALRGVSMEIRFLSIKQRKKWDLVFSIGSLIASFCQGLILGNLIEGIQPRTNIVISHPDPFYFLTPFTFFTGLLVVLLYMLIGANWLNYKTGHNLQLRIKKILPKILISLVVYIALFMFARTYWSLFRPRLIFSGVFQWTQSLTVLWILAGLVIFIALYWSLKTKKDWLPFLVNIFLFVFLGLFVVGHLWPFIVPPFVSLYYTGAPQYGNTVLLYGALIVIPIILSYLLYSYFVFKGKAKRNPDYEPYLTSENITRDSSRSKAAKVVSLSLGSKIGLKILWFGLFFVILGFLGDFIALVTIGLFIALFCFAWYKNSLNQAQDKDAR